MHPAVLLVTGLLIALLCLSWLRRSPAGVQSAAVWTVLGIAGVVLLIVLGTRLHWGLAPVLAAPLLWRLWRMVQGVRGAQAPRRGQASTVETEYVRMVIDHDSGEMTGEVLKGHLAGRSVESLDVVALRALLDECLRADPQGARIIESYLDRTHADWDAGRDEEANARNGAGPGLTRAQALEVLGLHEGATQGDVIAAHRRLMQKLHPDRGGSSYLAAQINRAKDLLLGY